MAGGAFVAALLVLVGAMVVAERRRRRRGVGEGATDEEELVLQALDDSLDDLRRERDVRRAIVACYARMERALARSVSVRRPHEAPFEYLARILQRAAGGGRAAKVLTELFERAKFSVEPMGKAEQEQAIAALEELRLETST